MSNKTLSDKIGIFVYHGDEGTSGYCEAIIVPNIKEAIKKLKGLLSYNVEQGNIPLGYYNVFVHQIDKIFGEKLT